MTRATKSGTPVARRTRAESTPCIDAYREHGTVAAASKALRMRRATFSERLAAERAGAAPKKAAPKPKAASAKKASTPRGGTGLAAAVAALVASQERQGKLLERLLSKPAKVTGEDPKPAKPEKPLSGGTVEAPETRVKTFTGRRVVVTVAQNNTPVHKAFWASLTGFCKEQGADLKVPHCTYNKAAWANGPAGEARIVKAAADEGDDEGGIWFDPAVRPYECDEPTEIAPGLILCGELDILPTAVDPLSGLESYTRTASGIVPHVKVAMKSMATMKGQEPRFLFTTGACTLRNYIARKSGQKAEFHHCFAALYVEVDEDGSWFVRQLVAGEDGCFHDLGRRYTPEGSEAAEVEAVVWGDIHREKCDEETIAACWDGRDSIFEALRPRSQVVHDLTDFTYRNHHNLKSSYFLARMHVAGTETVEGGMEACAAFLERIARPWCSTLVVESNHDQAFGRWLEEADGHRDPANAEYWHAWNARVFRSIRLAETDFLPFEAAVRACRELPTSRFLREDESCVLCPDAGGIEIGIHGHRGPNGSRGSPRAYRQMGRRAVTAHTHSAGIVDGVWTAGVTGRLDMDYNKGPSSWSQSHVVIHRNGKRQIVTMRGSRWRGTSLPKPRVRVKAGSATNDNANTQAAA